MPQRCQQVLECSDSRRRLGCCQAHFGQDGRLVARAQPAPIRLRSELVDTRLRPLEEFQHRLTTARQVHLDLNLLVHVKVGAKGA